MEPTPLTRTGFLSRRHPWSRKVVPLVILLGNVLTTACESRSAPGSPTVPSPSPSPEPPPWTSLDVRASGTVAENGGAPIAGASVSAVGSSATTVSNGSGAFELSGQFGSAAGFGLIARSDGYEPSYQWWPTPDGVQDISMRRIVRRAVGDRVRFVVEPSDTLYGSSEQYRGRRVRVVAPEAGRLVIEGSSETGHRVLLSDRDYEYFPCCPSKLELAVSAGQEVLINVLTYWLDVPADFTVTTRLEPIGGSAAP
jgi:hypothetical protein